MVYTQVAPMISCCLLYIIAAAVRIVLVVITSGWNGHGMAIGRSGGACEPRFTFGRLSENNILGALGGCCDHMLGADAGHDADSDAGPALLEALLQ